MTEQERREAVAAAAVHERQVAAAQERIDGAAAKLTKFKEHVKAIEADLKDAKQGLVDEETALRKARERAEKVLGEGPVQLGGYEVRAQADVAQADAAGKGGGN